MKLHLPPSLRIAVLSLFACSAFTVYAVAEEPTTPGDGSTTEQSPTTPGDDEEEPEEEPDDSVPDRENRKKKVTIYWQGNDGIWKYGDGAENWNAGKEHLEDTNFYDGDSVGFYIEGDEFDDTVTVTIDGEVAPSGVIDVFVDEDKTLIFADGGENDGGDKGQIVGKSSLQKDGAGTLEINTENKFTGGTILNEGTIKLGHVKALSTGKLTFNGGILDMNELKMANAIYVGSSNPDETIGNVFILNGKNYNGILRIYKGDLYGNTDTDATGEDRGVLNLKSGTHYLYGGTIHLNLASKGNITVSTNNETGVTILGSLTTTKTVNVNKGTLRLFAETIGGTFAVAKDASIILKDPLTLADGAKATFTFNSGSSLVSMSEDGIAIGTDIDITLNSATVMAFEEEDAEYSADIVVNGGNLTINNATLEGDVSMSAGKMKVSAGQKFKGLTLEGGTLDLTSGTITADSLIIQKGTITGDDGDETVLTEIIVGASYLKNGEKTYVIEDTSESSTASADNFSMSVAEGARFVYGADEKGVWANLDTYDLQWDDTVGTDAVWATGTETYWEKLNDPDQKSTFANLDNVTFDNISGTIKIEGEVNPGSITVEGDNDLKFESVTDSGADEDKDKAAGHIIGNGQLTKSGAGELTINTENDSYTGDIVINEGSVTIGEKGSLGNGGRIVVNDGATFNGGTITIHNDETDEDEEIARSFGARRVFEFNGNSSFSNVDFATNKNNIILGDGANVTGDKSMTVAGNIFVKGAGSSISLDEGTFTFNDGSSVSFEKDGTLKINNPVAFESKTSKTKIYLPETIQYSHTYVLMEFEPEEKTSASAILKHFSLDFVDPEMRDFYVLAYKDGQLILTMLRPPTPEEIAAELKNNPRNAYWAMRQIAQQGTASGILGAYAAYIANCKKPAVVSEMMDKLCGAELASAMSSQIEGNLAHLRRLRAHIGTGQFIEPKAGTMAAYATMYHDEHELKEDSYGLGHKRTVTGAVFGVESMLTQKVMLGAALSDGRARIKPSNQAPMNYEQVSRVDIYLAAHLAHGWQSVTTLGLGFHSFDYKRVITNDIVAEAKDIDARSINFSQEISYAISTSAQSSVRAFFSVMSSFNKISDFEEEGASGLSLAGDSRTAWATDVNVGLRFTRAFPVMHNLPDATFSVQAGLLANIGDTTADLDVHFAGAPNVTFNLNDARTRRWGYNVGADVLVPIAPSAAVSGSLGAVMRGDSHELSATLGLWFAF